MSRLHVGFRRVAPHRSNAARPRQPATGLVGNCPHCRVEIGQARRSTKNTGLVKRARSPIEKSSYPDIVLSIGIHAFLPIHKKIIFAREAGVFGIEFQHANKGRTHHRNTAPIATNLAPSERSDDGDQDSDGDTCRECRENGTGPGASQTRLSRSPTVGRGGLHG